MSLLPRSTNKSSNYRTLENSIRDKAAGIKPRSLAQKIEIRHKIIDSVEMNMDDIGTLYEANSNRRAVATLIATNLGRMNSKNTAGMLKLVAALSLLELSDGDDTLLAVAKRLASTGLSQR